jgi:hypothetical protein
MTSLHSRLKHDTAGFLVGDPLDLRKAVSLLESIRADVRAIRQAASGVAASAPNVSAKVDRAPVTPVRSISSTTEKSSITKAETIAAVNRQVAVMAKASKPAAVPTGRTKADQVAIAAGAVRDERGRFIGKSGSAGNSPAGNPGAGNPSISSDGFAKRVASAVREGISNSEEADPTVKAFNEVAEPLKRGYATIFGDRQEKQKNGWLRRIWNELKVGRIEQTAYEKAAAKSLKLISDKPNAKESESGGGFMGSVAQFATKIGSVVSTLMSVFKVAMLAIAPLLVMLKIKDWIEDSTHDEERVDGIKTNIADPLKNGLKKIGIDKDAEIESIREKNRRDQNGSDEYERMDRAKAAVAASGKYSDQFAGAKPGSPEYEAKLNELSAIPAFNQDVKGVYQGLDARDVEAKKGRLAKAWEGAKAFGGKIGDKWSDAKGYLLGASAKAGVDPGTVAKISNLESGFDANAAPIRKDGTRISSAHGYGQFLDGTWTSMVNKYGAKYGIEGAGQLTKEQAAKYRGDKTVQAGMLAEFTRENVEKGRKFGGTDDDANVYAFHNLGDKDAKNLLTGMKENPSMSVRDALLRGATTDKERARVEAVISGNKSLYGDGTIGAADAYGRMGQKMRQGEVFAADARATAKGLASVSPTIDAMGLNATMKPPQVATVSLPNIPSMPSAPQIPDAPEIQVPLSSRDSGRNITVAPPPKEHGQDLSNRRLAHIVTGGYAGA